MSLGSLQYCHSIQSPSILQSEESVITYLLCPPLHKTQVPFCLSVSSGRSYFEFRNSEFCRGHAVDPIEQVIFTFYLYFKVYTYFVSCMVRYSCDK